MPYLDVLVFCYFLMILICIYILLFIITQLITDVFVKGASTVTTLESLDSVALCGGFTPDRRHRG